MESDPETDARSELTPPERPVFKHPQWMLAVMLIFAVYAVIAGLSNPIFWLIGSPYIVVLAIWIYAKIKTS